MFEGYLKDCLDSLYIVGDPCGYPGLVWTCMCVNVLMIGYMWLPVRLWEYVSAM